MSHWSSAKGILALDLGTSSVKALVVDQDGTVVSRHATPIVTSYPAHGYAEQDVDDWLAAVLDATAHALDAASNIAIDAVAVTGQMHGTVMLDAERNPLGPAIVWSDQRATGEALAITSGFGSDLPSRIGGQLATGYQASTLAWIRANRPALWNRIDQVLLPKDFLILVLTGVMATDPSDAVSTGLLNVRMGQWDKEVLDTIGIDASWLPPIFPSGTPIVPLKQEAADAIGLVAGIPVVLAGGDAAAAAIGAGVTQPGEMMIALGTGAQVLTPNADFDPQLTARANIWPSAAPVNADGAPWNTVAAAVNGGNALHWLRSVAMPDLDLGEMLDLALRIPPGADGLLFLPYLDAERGQSHHAPSGGAFLGLRPFHGRDHLTRAVLEGLSMSLANLAGGLRGTSPPISHIVVGGGGAKSTLWLDVLANVFDAGISAAQHADLSAFGAARIAAHTLGWISIADRRSWLPEPERLIRPTPEIAGQYRLLLQIFRQATARTGEIGHQLASLGGSRSSSP